MGTPLLTNLLSDLADDFREPQFLWQVGTVLICFLMAWLLSRAVRSMFHQPEPGSGMIAEIGAGSFSRVLVPLTTLLLLLGAKAILGRWQHVNLLSLLVPVIGSLALIRFAFYVLRKTFVKEGRVGNFLATFEKLFAGLVWIGVVLHFTGLWPDLLAALDDVVLPVGKNKISLLSILQACISVVLTLIIALWASAALEARLMALPTAHTSFKVVMSRVSKALLIVLAVLASLTMVGIDLTVLSVFGGALGVGLGFGLQKIASNYVSGFIILLDRSMSIGDMISVDKFNGKVTQINTRYTVLQGLDGAESVIPNEMLVSTPVQNFSLTNTSVAMWTDFSVGYDTDLDALLPVLAQAALTVERVCKDPAPGAHLMRFGADGLELRVSFWIADPQNGKTGVLSDVNRALWAVMKERGIELPFPQRVVHIAAETSLKSDQNLVKS